jgi:HEAT repeat protein
MLLLALLVVLLPALQTQAAQTVSPMQSDVDRLVRAAESLAGTWPSQPPPPIPEVAIVARHGKAVVPLLMALLSDDPQAERDRKRWKVQQQAALTLTEIYSESQHCGRTYCDGDPPERIGRVRTGWLNVIASDKEMRALSSRELLDRFKSEKVFWRQFEIAEALAAANDRGAIAELEGWLTHDDRHLRGNVAFVLGRLGDPRGFETIAAILSDRSPRSAGQGIPGSKWTVPAQIRADRYYAAHLLGDRRGIGPLVAQTDRDDPSLRVLAIGALERLKAREALPRLRQLLQDDRRSNFGDRTTVADTARRAIAVISQLP